MELGAREPDGYTLREHLQAAARQGGVPDPRLVERLPEHGAALWDAFAALAASRPVGVGGSSAIPPTELLAWQQIHGVRLTGWEVDTLHAMDRAALSVMARRQKAVH